MMTERAMVAGRAESLNLITNRRWRGHEEWQEAFEVTSLVYDTLPPIKPHLLTFPKHFYQWGPRVQACESVEAIIIQVTPVSQ